MNRRQAKKAYKKKHGHNPPKAEVRFYPKYYAKAVIKAMDALPELVAAATTAIGKMCEVILRISKETIIQIQTMPEEDFNKMLESSDLDERTKETARKLRGIRGTR